MKHRKVLNLLAILSLVGGMLTGIITTQAQQADLGALTRTPAYSLPVSETGLYIIELVDPAVPVYRGGIGGLRATSPESTGARRLDAQASDVQAYQTYLQGKQTDLLQAMQRAFGRVMVPAYSYQYALNGMAIYLSHEEALSLFEMPGVAMVYADALHSMDTDMGPTLIGAPAIWEGETSGGIDSKGEGIVVGVIDGGINHAHPAFTATGADGYTHINPYGAGIYHGYCATNPGFCNSKLIGAYYLYTGPAQSPEDTDGHGSHTSSTAAGNAHLAEFSVGTEVFTRQISGVAPHANIVAYKICNPLCPDSSAVAAVDLAINADLVDVINFSISGEDNPWKDSVDKAFLNAFAAGIFVSASAGNDGPTASTVAHTGPWNSTVGASTHSRVIANFMDVTITGGALVDLLAVPAQETVVSSNITGDLLWAGDVDPANISACAAFPADSFGGMFGVAQRGGCTFEIKVNNLIDAGAVGAVIYNNVAGPPITMGFDVIPAYPSVMTTLEEGLDLVDLIGGRTDARMTIKFGAEVVIDPAWNDIMAGLSSRGPSAFELLKPDYVAPGVNILAAVSVSGGDVTTYDFYQGTSMASPHSAGAAALMMALHPDWTVAELRSALNSTADPSVVRDSDGATPADPFDMGSGRLALSGAGNAGLVLNETSANYLAADPSLGGDPTTLNQPNLVSYDCAGECVWTRTVRSVSTDTQTWTVAFEEPAGLDLSVLPASFELEPGESQVLTITADVSAATPFVTLFGAVNLVPGESAGTRLPVVVVVAGGPPEISVDPAELTSTQIADLATRTLTINNLGGETLTWQLYEDGSEINALTGDWGDNFDSYVTGSEIHGQGGWKGWDNNITYGALVNGSKYRSLPNSVAIVGNSNLVHEFTEYATGYWTITAWQFIPGGYAGVSTFNILNTYADLGTSNNYSVQVLFDSATQQVINQGASAHSLPLITGRWVELRVEVDLVNDLQTFFYDGAELYSGTWTDEVTGDGALNIAAVNMNANDTDVIYYDDMAIVMDTPAVCDLAGDIAWLSTDPVSGTTAPLSSSPVSVLFDARGMAVGTYTATLCASSNDPLNPLVLIPVTLTVVDELPTFFIFLPIGLKAPTP